MAKAKGFGEWFASQQGGQSAADGVPVSAPAAATFAEADLEAGTAAAAAGESETSSFLGKLSSALHGSLRVGPLADGSSPAAPPEWTCGLSLAQRMHAFALLLAGSLALYAVSLFVFLPMLLLSPAKFATSFTLASLLWMAAFAVLRGPRTTLVSLFGSREKLPFTIAYVGSLALTLYATVGGGGYFLVLLALCVQLAALVWYGASYFPGGTAAIGALSRMCCGGLGSGSFGMARAALSVGASSAGGLLPAALGGSR